MWLDFNFCSEASACISVEISQWMESVGMNLEWHFYMHSSIEILGMTVWPSSFWRNQFVKCQRAVEWTECIGIGKGKCIKNTEMSNCNSQIHPISISLNDRTEFSYRISHNFLDFQIMIFDFANSILGNYQLVFSLQNMILIQIDSVLKNKSTVFNLIISAAELHLYSDRFPITLQDCTHLISYNSETTVS